MKADPRNFGFSTRAVHAGQKPDPRTGSVAVPIYQTSTYVQEQLGEPVHYEYARVQNPTREALEEQIRVLEGGFSGHAFASGMAAISCLMTVVKAGDHVVVSRNVYGGTFRYFTRILERYGLTFSWVDTTDLAAVEAAIRPETRMVYLETPTNPVMDITDIAAVAEIAHAHGARVAVDNTFLTPYLQRPLALGADFVVHSATKFLNGHSDSICGVLIVVDAGGRRLVRAGPEVGGRDPVAVRLLPGDARHQDARRPHGPARAERAQDRRLPRRAPEGEKGALSRAAGPSRP